MKVVILSSSDHPTDIRRAKTLGAEDYLIKPHSPTDLLKLIHEIQQRWLPVSPAPKAAEPA